MLQRLQLRWWSSYIRGRYWLYFGFIIRIINWLYFEYYVKKKKQNNKLVIFGILWEEKRMSVPLFFTLSLILTHSHSLTHSLRIYLHKQDSPATAGQSGLLLFVVLVLLLLLMMMLVRLQCSPQSIQIIYYCGRNCIAIGSASASTTTVSGFDSQLRLVFSRYLNAFEKIEGYSESPLHSESSWITSGAEKSWLVLKLNLKTGDMEWVWVRVRERKKYKPALTADYLLIKYII